MIGPNNLAAGVIAWLKADTAIAAYLAARNATGEIRQLSWHGREFVYPAIRVDIGTESPFENGPCGPTRSQLPFRVYTFSEQDSSYECGELAGLVHARLFSQKIDASVTYGFTTTLITMDGWPNPVMTGENIWQCVMAFRCQINGGIS